MNNMELSKEMFKNIILMCGSRFYNPLKTFFNMRLSGKQKYLQKIHTKTLMHTHLHTPDVTCFNKLLLKM